MTGCFALKVRRDHRDATLDAALSNRRKEIELEEALGGERGGDGEQKALARRLEKASHRAPTSVLSLAGAL